MDRDDLVERVAMLLAPYMGCEECGVAPGECLCRAVSRAALAIIEGAVREECAKVADDVVEELQANISDNIAEVRVIEIAPEANRRLIFARDWMRHTAAAIRAGAKP